MATDAQSLLRRVVMAWDTNDDLEFLAAVTAARAALGLKLADEQEAADDAAALVANGYTADGQPIGQSRSQWEGGEP